VTKNKEAIKEDILGEFRSIRVQAGAILPPNWLQYYFQSLNTKEQEIFEEAVKELCDDEIVEYVKHPPINLRLTKKGEDLFN
jgi:hypothetical protein